MSTNYAKYSGLGGGGGSGTVTSVGLTAPASILSVSGSPVTTSGTLALSLATQVANKVWAGPTTGAAATPTFRSLVAADLPFVLTNLTDAGTDGIVITNGTGAVVGASPVTIAQHVADATHNGYLSSTDWNTFNNKQATLTLTNLTDAGTDGITITNGTGAVIGASPVTVSQHVADATHNGYLLSTDWVAFNAKQAAGNYITALTGDVTANGPGSVAATLATVNGNVGTFASVTVNAKGLTTAATALSGDATTSGAVLTLATVNGNVGTFASVTVNAKGLVTAATALSGDATTSGAVLTLATVNSNTGTFGSASVIPAITVNGKGLITAVSSISPTTAPVASTFVGWDANKNASANNHLNGYATTATAAGTTTLTVGSTRQQYFTGATTQTVLLPVASTLVLGLSFTIVNQSSGVVTVQSSGANTIQAMATNTQLVVTCILTSGTGTASWQWTYNPVASGLPLTNPMTTGGDIIYGGAGGTPTRLANGSNLQYLKSTGGTAAPAWTTFTTPTIQKFTATGTTTGWLFTITTSSTVAVNDTYTNNSVTYTVLNALTAQSGQVLFCSGAGAPLASGTLTRSAGAGTASITFTSAVALATYTTASNVAYIRVRLVGGGGGGAGGATSVANNGGNGGTGGTTAFGANIIVANGGGGAVASGSPGASGGTASLGTGPIGIALAGGGGGAAFDATIANIDACGGVGGNSAFGGGGPGGAIAGTNGTAGAANTGGGGSGGGGATRGVNGTVSGSGGGSGGFVDAIIASPNATYVYTVGLGGTNGAAGTSGGAGAAGGTGLVEITEYYQ